MDSVPQVESQKRVQLIISAKSSGGGPGSKLSGLPRAETQERFTRALENAAIEVFEMMVGTPLCSSDQVTLPLLADYTSMIGLAGDICGVLSFRCSNKSAGQIAGKMLGMEEVASAECIRDALGEICNMVAGAFKAQAHGHRRPVHALGPNGGKRQGLSTLPAGRRDANPNFKGF